MMRVNDGTLTHFVSKLSDSEGEAEETRVWLEFARRCNYLTEHDAQELDETYDRILGQLVDCNS